MTTAPPALSAHALHKRFKLKGAARPVHALDDVTLDVPAGQLTALVGPDGAGMKQRFGLACTLVRSPALLLAEPTAGVDPLWRRELGKIMQQLSVRLRPFAVLRAR